MANGKKESVPGLTPEQTKLFFDMNFNGVSDFLKQVRQYVEEHPHSPASKTLVNRTRRRLHQLAKEADAIYKKIE